MELHDSNRDDANRAAVASNLGVAVWQIMDPPIAWAAATRHATGRL